MCKKLSKIPLFTIINIVFCSVYTEALAPQALIFFNLEYEIT